MITDLKDADQKLVPLQTVPQKAGLLHRETVLQRLLVPAVCAVQTHQLVVDVGVVGPQLELRLKQLVQLVGALLSSCAQKLLLQQRENACELRGQRVFSEQADVP